MYSAKEQKYLPAPSDEELAIAKVLELVAAGLVAAGLSEIVTSKRTELGFCLPVLVAGLLLEGGEEGEGDSGEISTLAEGLADNAQI